MDIKHRQVEIFHAVMTTGGVTQAAQLLRTSQPTVSRELRSLERLLGFSLFERKSRRLSATEKAVLLHAEVQRSFSGLQHIAQAAQAIRDNRTSHVEIACMPLFAQTIMPNICRRFLETDSAARLSFNTLDQSILLKELVGLRYEFGLLETRVAVDGLSVQEFPLGDELCVLPRGHPLCERDVIEPKDLENESFISFTSDDVYYRRYSQVFEEASMTKRATIETTTAEAVCALVGCGVGVAIVNPVSAYACRDQNIEIRKFSVSIPFVIGICRPLGRPMTELGNRLAKIMVDECRSLQTEIAAIKI